MIENPVVIPLEGDAQLEVDSVISLGDGQHVHEAGGNINLDWQQGFLLLVDGDGEGRNFVVVAFIKHNKLAVVLI